jgi:hypothetical protein
MKTTELMEQLEKLDAVSGDSEVKVTMVGRETLWYDVSALVFRLEDNTILLEVVDV